MAFLDKTGLEQLWLHIVSKLGNKVDKVDGMGLSTNDYTTAEKEQLVTLSGLVGDTAVSTQINNAVSKITPENIGALNTEDYYGIVRKEGSLVSADSLEGLAIGVVSDIVPLQSGTGDPSPTNVRPIGGWDVASLNRTKKNLLGFEDHTYTGTAYTDTCASGVFRREVAVYHTTTYVITTTGIGYLIHRHIPAGTYTFTLTYTSTSGATFSSPYLEVTLLDGTVAKLPNGEATTIAGGTITGVRASSKGFSAGAVIEYTMQLEAGTGTSYEPYSGATITASLPETVYGGNLDWTTGVLTATHYVKTLDGTEAWADGGSGAGVYRLDYGVPSTVQTDNQRAYHICSHYKPAAYKSPADQADMTCYTLNASHLCVKDTTAGTLDGYKAYLAAQAAAGTPVTLLWPLKPAYYSTIQLTPQQLEAIDGTNYVWSDCGDTCVTFNYTPFLDIVNTKVDKVDGMGLSTNDYTTAEKDKLSGIEDGANKTVVDTELSSTSTNPVQNQVISAAIDDLSALVGDTTVSSQVSNAIADLVNGAPTTLDTLGEIATAMEENADVVAALDSAIGSKANADDLTSHINDKSNPHSVTLNQLDVTATAAELNYVSGVTGHIQTQLDELSIALTDAEIDAICGTTLEFDDLLTDETTGTAYKLYVSNGDLKMTEVTE